MTDKADPPAPQTHVEASKEYQNAVGVGMAIAAGIVMNVWGETVIAKEILGAAGGNTETELRGWGVDDYDIDILRPILTSAEGSTE